MCALPAEAKAETDWTADIVSYTVMVPAELLMDAQEQSGKLQIEGRLGPCRKLEICIDSENGYVLQSESELGTLPYRIDSDGLSSEGKLEFLSDENEIEIFQDIRVEITDFECAAVSGIYTDTLTFTMDCVDIRDDLLIEDEDSGFEEDEELEKEDSSTEEENGSREDFLNVETATGSDADIIQETC